MSYTLVPKNNRILPYYANIPVFSVILHATSELCPEQWRKTEIQPPQNAPPSWAETVKNQTCHLCNSPCREQHSLWLLQERQQVNANDARLLGLALLPLAPTAAATETLLRHWSETMPDFTPKPHILMQKLQEFAAFLQNSGRFDIRF